MQQMVIDFVDKDDNTTFAILAKIITADNENYYCKKESEADWPEFFGIKESDLQVSDENVLYVRFPENVKPEDVIVPWEPDEYTKWRIEHP